MNPARDAIIIIAIVVGLAVISTTVRNSENFQSDFVKNGSVQTYSPPQNQTSEEEVEVITKEEEQQMIESEIIKIQAELAQVEKELEQVEKYGETSPYKGMVTMRKSAAALRSTNADKERIQLDASNKNESKVTITGWRLESAITGRSVSIPKAVYLVFAGSSNSKLPVLLMPGDTAYITTGRSPIGQSFKVNKCTGYYTQFQTFVPSISRKCPLPEEEILFYTRDTSIFLENDCMDFVDRMSRCRIPTKALPLTLSYACQEAIIDEINYNSCVDKHKNDEDFRIPDWRIYLRRDTELWRDKRELIKLLDENGKTVDYYSY